MSEKIKAIIRSIILYAIMAAAICMIAIRPDWWVLVIGIILAVITFGYALWKNENFTHAATQGQRVVSWIKEVQPQMDNNPDTVLLAETAFELQDGVDPNAPKSEDGE